MSSLATTHPEIAAVDECHACGGVRTGVAEDHDGNPVCADCAPIDYAALIRIVRSVVPSIVVYADLIHDAECEIDGDEWMTTDMRTLQNARVAAVFTLRMAAVELAASLSLTAREVAADLRREAFLIEAGIWLRDGGRRTSSRVTKDRIDNLEAWVRPLVSYEGSEDADYLADDRVDAEAAS